MPDEVINIVVGEPADVVIIEPVEEVINIQVTEPNDLNISIVENPVYAQLKRTITVEKPSSTEKIPILFTSAPATISKIRAVIKGTGDITFNIVHGPDINAAGTPVTNSPVPVSNTTTGVDSVRDNPGVLANSWVWLIATGKTGVVDWISVTVEF